LLSIVFNSVTLVPLPLAMRTRRLALKQLRACAVPAAHRANHRFHMAKFPLLLRKIGGL